MDMLPALFASQKVERVLLVTDASIRALGLTSHLEQVLAQKQIQCIVYDKTVANPTTVNVEDARMLYLKT